MDAEPVVFASLTLRVEPASYRAELDGRVLTLEPKVFDLLVLLLTNGGHLLTKQQILDAVWAGTAVSDNALTRVVAQLRKALGDDARESTYLETIPTRGYRWRPPVRRLSAAALEDVVTADSPGGSTPLAAAPAARGKWGRQAFAAVVLLAAAVWLWADARRSSGPRTVFPRQATVSSGLDVYPSLSPDGNRLVYSSDRSGRWELYIRPTAGPGEDTALTGDGEQNLQAAWSPDGRHIAFHSMRRGGIWIVPASGGSPRQVTTFGARPAWSPDGRRLAFQSEAAPDIGPAARAANLPSTIWIVDVGGGQPRPVTRRGIPVGGHGAPAWSPDGRHIAFATADFGVSQIWAAAPQGGEPHLISGDLAPSYDPAYLPDGRSLIFAAGPRVWRVPLGADGKPAGAAESFSAAGLQNLRHLSVARSGRVAAAGLSLRTSLWSVTVDGEGKQASEPRALTNDTRVRNSLPAFSPDGRRIALMSSVAGQLPDVWMMNADGSHLEALTSERTFEGSPGWTPDARHVTFKSIRDGRVGVWQIDVDSRREDRLADFGTVEEATRYQGLVQEAKVSNDATRIAYAVLDPHTSSKAIYVRPLRGSAAVRISSGEPPASYPSWSPDGRWIACELQDLEGAHAAVLPAGGGTPRRLTNARGHSWVHGWSPDSTRVLFAGQRNGVWNVYWVPRDGGEEQQVTNNTRVSNFIRYPAWSPLGTQIVYEYGDLRGNVWVVDLR